MFGVMKLVCACDLGALMRKKRSHCDPADLKMRSELLDHQQVIKSECPIIFQSSDSVKQSSCYLHVVSAPTET